CGASSLSLVSQRQKRRVAAQGRRIDGDGFLGSETQQVVWPSCLGTGARQALPAKRLNSHYGTDDIAVYVDITNTNFLRNELREGFIAAVYAKCQAVTLGVDCLDDMFDFTRPVAHYVQNGTELLALQCVDAVDTEGSRRNKGAVTGMGRVKAGFSQQATFGLELVDMRRQVLASFLVNDRAYVGSEVTGVADVKLLHGATQNLDDPVGHLLLQKEHPQCAATLPGTLIGRLNHIGYHLFR